MSGKKISLSSWNYGTFSLCNPYFKINSSQFQKPVKIYEKQNLINGTNKSINIVNHSKERIVKDIDFKNLDYMNYIRRDSEEKIKRAKSAKINNNNIKNNNNNEYQISFEDWKKNKNKQIRKNKSLEKKKLEEEKNKNIKPDNRITYKMWIKNKNKFEKEQKEKKEKKEKEEKEKKDELDKERRENMNKWLEEKTLNEQNKIEQNKLKRKERKNKKKEENKQKKENEEKNKIIFINWIKRKNKEKKEEKEKNKNIKCDDNSNKKYIKRKYSEVIGPYSYAKILRKMQNIYNNNNVNIKDKVRNNSNKK